MAFEPSEKESSVLPEFANCVVCWPTPSRCYHDHDALKALDQSLLNTKLPQFPPTSSSSSSDNTLLLGNQQFSDHGGVGSDRMSDDSSKEAVSDSHPDTLTDPEFSDPPIVTSSPPQSGDEVRRDKEKAASSGPGATSSAGGPSSERRSRLFSKDKTSGFSLKQQKQGSSSSSSANHHRSDRLNAHQPSQDVTNQPRKALLEQLSRVLPSDIDTLPDQLILANTCDRQGAHLAAKLVDWGHRVIFTAGQGDVRAALTCLVAKIQKFCNTKTQSPQLVKVALVGSDTFVNSVLRPYVELFSSKPPDWQGFVKFFIIPLGINTVSKHIGSQDPIYASLFLHESWRELLEKAEPDKSEVGELVNRITQYLSDSAENLMPLPVAEAMVTYKEKSSDEESSQVFIPFVSDVRVGTDSHLLAGGVPSVDLDDSLSLPSGTILGSPPPDGVRPSPPSSPYVGGVHNFGDPICGGPSQQLSGAKERSAADSEPIDLQLDYWAVDFGQSGPGTGSGGQGSFSGSGPSGNITSSSGKRLDHSSSRSDSRKGGGSGEHGGGKASIKTSVWYMQVLRLGVPNSSGEQPTFSMSFWLKEKKQKTVMRLGKKKEKDKESEMRTVDGITRLICLSKGQTPLKVYIDGLEWTGVKFFQLSPQWQTHIKYFPVASLSATLGSGNQTAL